MRRNRFHSLICIWAASTIAAGGCRAPTAPVTRPKVVNPNAPAAIAVALASSGRPQVPIETDATEGRLSVRTPNEKVVAAETVVTALTADATKALHARMEPLPDLAAPNAAAPTLRAPTPAPPRSGPAHPIAFVVPTGKAVSDAPVAPSKVTTPLAMPQISPQGEVRSESEIRVRFGEAMVPVASVGAVGKPIATIAPAVGGTWRWIDTRVATFTASNPRLPQATDFTVVVPAGTKALSGATLAADAKATFTTPPISISGGYPTTALRPESAILVKLDQDMTADQVLPFLRVTNEKGKTLPHKATTLAEAQQLWAHNPAIAFDPAKTTTLLGARYVVLAPQTAWPAGSEIQVVMKPGAPSREGPRVSVRESFVRFPIAPAFTALGVTCGDLETARMFGARCPAKSYVEVHFSNPIALHSYRSNKLQIDGEDFEDNAPRGNTVSLYAPPVVGRTYGITVGGDLVDIYGQPLVGGRRMSFVTGAERFGAYVDAPTGLQVLDPRFEIPQWVIHTEAVAALRVQLFQVQPKDYFAYEEYEQGTRTTPPGKRVHDKTYAVGPQHGVDLRVDLRPALNPAGLGHVIAVATAAPAPGQRRQDNTVAWMQVTRLGLSTRIDGEAINAWVQNITPTARFLAPIAGVSTSILVEGGGEPTATASGAEGHVRLELAAPPVTPRAPGREVTALVQAQSATDSTFTAIGTHEKSVRVDNALWYVTDDRFTYKPGEKVYVKGWVRWTHNGIDPDIALPKAGESVSYILTDSRGSKITSGSAAFSDQGGFHLEATIPPNVNLGTASFSFSTRNDHHHRHPISVQEFRTPAYSVALNDDVSHSGATPLILGETIEMGASAKYYSGGGLGGADIQWDAKLTTTDFHPPGWNMFGFAPPPRSRSQQQYSYRYRSDDTSVEARQAGSLSGASTAAIVYGITALPRGRASILEVDATVTDVDRMSIRASSRPILVHPSAYYVGLRLRPGTTDTIEAVVTDLDGNAVAGVPIEVAIEGVLGSERYRDDAVVIDRQSCNLTSATTASACPWTRKDLKTAYTATARIADPRGRTNASQFPIPWWSHDDKRDLVIVPDKAEYRPGDVAKLEIRSLVTPATAVVTFARQGVIAQRRLELIEESTTIELPIDVTHIQNVFVVVDRYAKRQHVQAGSKLPLPESASVELSLPVDIEGVRLVMKTRSTQKLVQPGDNATFEVEVRHDDKPVADAEVALMVVDEAILALSAKSHVDPLGLFYRKVGDGTSATSTLSLVRDSGDTLAGSPGYTRFKLGELGTIGHGSGTGSGYGSGGGGMSGRGTMGVGIVTARKDFRANAVFAPVLRTDASGKVSLTVKMPDSLTRFRIVALATANNRYFGKAESNIVTQRKVNARTVAPRFLTQGDTFSLPVVVQNLDTAPRTVDLAVRAANLVGVGPAGKRVVVPGGQRAEVRFDFTTKARGRAVIQTIATSGDFADASNIELPIYEPATTESFATYGTVDDATQFEQLVVPASIFPDVGGVEVELASTQLQSLTDAFWYLYAYPYECAEQRSGRMLATAAMYDILDAFAAPNRPTRAEIDAMRKQDARVLEKEQRADGGWGYFQGIKSDPYVSMQVLTALAAQKITGKVTTSATAYVSKESNALFARLEQAVATQPAQRKDRHEHPYVISLAAATLSALSAAGVDVRPRAERLHAIATTLAAYPVDAKARLLSLTAKLERARAMRTKLLTELVSATHETASSATVTTTFVESERLLLVSNNKTSALALDAIMREAPDHALVTKLARGVLDGRRHGRWMSTQENLVALQTMRRYFDTYEKVTPNYTGKLWFGSAAYAEQAFVGRSNARGQARADWTSLTPGSTHDLALAKAGPGRMYYRVGITYAPKQTNLPALDAGFIVRRNYTAADDPADVIKTKDGYKIRLGAKVLVTLETLNTTRRYAVALVDPLPAGFEAVNENLATAERAVAVVSDTHWDHTNMRDNRSEAFRMSLEEGTHRFSYTIRATTPGTFIAAPTKAEEMYSPETFGRSSGQTVVIE